tara:strand:- start:6 stop:119 length:114 start_codon:yes stop_codon:yes gene_type:complete
MNKLYCFLTVLFVGFSIGAFQEEGPYTQAGYVLADQY